MIKKNVMQDVIQPDKKSIRRIPVERAKRTAKNITSETKNEEFLITEAKSDLEVPIKKTQEEVETSFDMNEPTLPPQPPRLRKERSAGRFWILGIGVLVLALVLVAALSFLFSGARVTVHPLQERATINGQFVANAEPEPGALGFEVMTITKELAREVKATGERQVDIKASGRITIYNNFDNNTQRLIKNTRFETPEGLTFRIQDSVVIPGRHENDDEEVVPGSLEVEVFADTSGEEYNVGLTDFTIPGFEGDPRFFKFFARSETEMTGGFSGIRKTVSEEDEDAARSEMQSELKASILAEAQGEVPAGFVLYEDNIFVEFNSRPNESAGKTDKINLVESATLYGFMFDTSELSEEIAEGTLASYDGASVRFIELEDLNYTLIDGDLFKPESRDVLDFMLEGSGLVVWNFDDRRLKEDLAGKHRDDVEMVLSGYPAIERAQIKLRPFWKRIFPEEIKKIKIEEVIQTDA